MPDQKRILIASTVRAGSTLLKSLLAEAPDVSYLPERPFHTPLRASSCRLVVLKQPARPYECWSYPLVPEDTYRVICLVRGLVDTVYSIERMISSNEWHPMHLYDVVGYVKHITANLHAYARTHDHACLVLFEDLIEDPVRVTAMLFDWLGSDRTEGVATYRPRTWRWGEDDAGDLIHTCRVQRPPGSVAERLDVAGEGGPKS